MSEDNSPKGPNFLQVMASALAAVFGLNAWRLPKLLEPIPLVDPSFLDTSPNRRSYADLVRAKDEDALSDFDCYACHATPMKKGPPAPVRSCFACHAKDDVHRGAFGSRCERCHATSSWPATLVR